MKKDGGDEIKGQINILKSMIEKSLMIGSKNKVDSKDICKSTFQSEYHYDSDSTDLWDTFHQERESIPSYNIKTAPLLHQKYKIDDSWSNLKNINIVDSERKGYASMTANIG